MSPAHQHKYDKDGLPVLSALETVSLTLAMLRMRRFISHASQKIPA